MFQFFQEFFLFIHMLTISKNSKEWFWTLHTTSKVHKWDCHRYICFSQKFKIHIVVVPIMEYIRPLKQLCSARLYLSIVKLSVNIDLALCDVSCKIWCGMRDIWTEKEKKEIRNLKQNYSLSSTSFIKYSSVRRLNDQIH